MNELKNDRKAYASPTIRKLTPEQAKRFLASHASSGDPGATEVLELLEQEMQERLRFLAEGDTT